MVISAGLLLYRFSSGKLEVLLVHPGGPFWAKKDNYSWSIPKGEIDPQEDVQAAAHREFGEEVGVPAPDGKSYYLGEAKLTRAKIGKIWTLEGDVDAAKVKSNTFKMESPPKSGNFQEFPEIDRGGWFKLGDAYQKIAKTQSIFLDRLAEHLKIDKGLKDKPPAQDDVQVSLL